MNRSPQEIDREIKKFTKRLREVALADNQITSDEEHILKVIETKIQYLQIQLLQVLESDLSDDEFEDILSDVLQDILTNVERTAKEDGIITSDEKNLLEVVRNFVDHGGSLDE